MHIISKEHIVGWQFSKIFQPSTTEIQAGKSILLEYSRTMSLPEETVMPAITEGKVRIQINESHHCKASFLFSGFCCCCLVLVFCKFNKEPNIEVSA